MSRKRKPTLYRRLRVVRDDHDKTTARALREVYLEVSSEPWMTGPDGQVTQGVWRIELSGIQLPCVQVMDLIKWAESLNISVEYDPPQNMAGWMGKKKKSELALDLQYLFDI